MLLHDKKEELLKYRSNHLSASSKEPKEDVAIDPSDLVLYLSSLQPTLLMDKQFFLLPIQVERCIFYRKALCPSYLILLPLWNKHAC